MKTILLIPCLFISLGSMADTLPRSEIIRDAHGAILEKWLYAPLKGGGWHVTVRDAAGNLLRVFLIPPSK